MILPQEVQNLIKTFLEKVRGDPNHVITTFDRLEIYQSFGPSRLDKYIEIEKSKPKSRLFTFLPPEDEFDDLIEDTPANAENLIQSCKIQFTNFTVADYAQSWLAILTVEKVLFVSEDWNWNLYALDDTPKKDA